jgi:uncharacterized protein (TIGR02246 family)
LGAKSQPQLISGSKYSNAVDPPARCGSSVNATDTGREEEMVPRRRFFLVPFAGLAMPAHAQQPGAAGPLDTRRAVEALLAKFVEGYNRKDVAVIAALFADDAVLVPPGPMVTGKRAIAQDYRRRLEHGAEGLRLDLLQAEGSGDLAWAVGQFRVSVPGDDGRRLERRGNFTTLYRRQGDELLIRVHAFNFLPQLR